MAGLLFVVCSAIEELYRVGRVFIQSDGSLEQCWKYLIETRQEHFINRYLKYLDSRDNNYSDWAIGKREFDNLSSSPSSSQNREGNSFWWGGDTPDSIMAYQEIYEHTPYDDVVDFAIIKVSYFPQYLRVKLELFKVYAET